MFRFWDLEILNICVPHFSIALKVKQHESAGNQGQVCVATLCLTQSDFRGSDNTPQTAP